jgi:citrate synthase
VSQPAAVSVRGLQDVVAGTTAVSMVDPKGVLVYRGYDIDDLAEHASYEEVAYLLLIGALPNRAELEQFRQSLMRERALSPFLLRLIADMKSATPMDALRTVVSASALEDPDEGDNSHAANLRKATRLVAKIPTIVAAYMRARRGQEPIAPDPRVGHAENFAHMAFGDRAVKDAPRILNVAFILQADHGFNASTFTARVVAGTNADMHAAITAALAALKGPLHGGATDGTMKQLQEIGSPDRAEAYVEQLFARKGRLSGWGHRVYKDFDPRAKHLHRMARELADRGSNGSLVAIQERVQAVVPRLWQGHTVKLFPNVDYFAATTYNLLGIDADLGTSIFAIGRMAGWCAHVIEQHDDNRLIRPESEYTGARGLRYVPIDQR